MMTPEETAAAIDQDRTHDRLKQVIDDAPVEIKAAMEAVRRRGMDCDDEYAAFVALFGALAREMRPGDLKTHIQSLRNALADHLDSLLDCARVEG